MCYNEKGKNMSFLLQKKIGPKKSRTQVEQHGICTKKAILLLQDYKEGIRTLKWIMTGEVQIKQGACA